MPKTSILNSTKVVLITLIVLVFSFIVLKTNLFDNGISEPSLPSISAVIVPHHDLAANLREETLRQIMTRVDPKTIVLISPNHFDIGDYNIITTNREWRLTNAYFEPDQNKISRLNIPVDDAAFVREHGITNLLDPLRNAFPDAKIIPIILKQNTPASELDSLNTNLKKACKNECLMVSSVDFSHYQPASVASNHDLLSIKALTNLDANLVWQTEVDSNPALYLTINWAKSYKTNFFRLTANTNSGLLNHAPDAESTSYVLGWFEQGKLAGTDTQTFVAGFNLKDINQSNPRLVTGIDQKIDLNDNHEMGMTCYAKPEYCAINRLFWGPNFYRDILNGLVVTGEIQSNNYKLVLTPTDPITHQALTGKAKLAVINRVREKIGLNDTQISDGYDTIEITK